MKVLNGDTRLVGVHEIRPHDQNPRQGDVGAIHESIKENGFYGSVIVQASSNRILVGNHRWKAAIENGASEIPATFIDVDDDRALRILLADNKTNDDASYDLSALAEILSELANTSDLLGTGYDADELDQIISDLSGVAGGGGQIGVPEPQIDRAEELRVKGGVEYGQLWRIGRHRLLCGDSTCEADVKRLMDGQKASFAFCDPPYGYEYQSNMRTKSKKFAKLKNDDKILDGFVPHLAIASDGWVIVCTAWKVISEWLSATKPLGPLQNMIIWDKGGGGMGDLSHSLSTDYEIMLGYNRGAELTGKRIGSVWGISKDQAEDYEHATQKPVALVLQAFDCFAPQRCLVYDGFVGGGTVHCAAESTNRTCFGIDMEPGYVAVTLERLSQMGLTPELVTQDG